MSQDLHAEEPQEQANMSQLPTIILPAQTLIALCGPAASGKSTFARTFIARHQAEGINSTAIISSDDSVQSP